MFSLLKKIRRGSERIIKISTESTFEKNSNIDFFFFESQLT